MGEKSKSDQLADPGYPIRSLRLRVLCRRGVLGQIMCVQNDVIIIRCHLKHLF